eukprot:6965652-Prorocentrum_lima.AAC.1
MVACAPSRICDSRGVGGAGGAAAIWLAPCRAGPSCSWAAAVVSIGAVWLLGGAGCAGLSPP